MPKRRTTPKQKAASRRNLQKARAAKKSSSKTPVGKSGMIKLYHRTSPTAADQIVQQQKFVSKHSFTKDIFFSAHNNRHTSLYGKAVLTVRINKKKAKLLGDNTDTYLKPPFRGYSEYTVNPKALQGKKIRRHF